IQKIEAADSQQKAQELQMEANDKMVSVIEDVGIDIPTYNSITTAYSSEPTVRNRVDALMYANPHPVRQLPRLCGAFSLQCSIKGREIILTPSAAQISAARAVKSEINRV